MMSMNVKDYVKIYDEFLDIKFCKKLVKKLKKQDDWVKHSYYDAVTDKHHQTEDELSISYAENLEETAIINEKVWFAIQRYLQELNFPWFNGWSGYQHIRYNLYLPNTTMKLHCDHIQSIFEGRKKGIPSLSVLGALNDDYENGELIFWESEVVNLKAGQLMIFPSNFLYPHQVNSVTKGARYSYVSWVW